MDNRERARSWLMETRTSGDEWSLAKLLDAAEAHGRVLEAAPQSTGFCNGRTSLCKDERCPICSGVRAAAPLPTAREHDAFTMHCPKCGIDVFAHGETCPKPVSSLQRTAGDVIRQFRESGSEDWGELESAINWWLWNDALPTLGKSVSEGRLRELVAKWRGFGESSWGRHLTDESNAIEGATRQQAKDCADELERALESA